jgi:hypothetical protein
MSTFDRSQLVVEIRQRFAAAVAAIAITSPHIRVRSFG